METSGGGDAFEAHPEVAKSAGPLAGHDGHHDVLTFLVFLGPQAAAGRLDHTMMTGPLV